VPHPVRHMRSAQEVDAGRPRRRLTLPYSHQIQAFPRPRASASRSFVVRREQIERERRTWNTYGVRPRLRSTPTGWPRGWRATTTYSSTLARATDATSCTWRGRNQPASLSAWTLTGTTYGGHPAKRPQRAVRHRQCARAARGAGWDGVEGYYQLPLGKPAHGAGGWRAHAAGGTARHHPCRSSAGSQAERRGAGRIRLHA
jgi:hypothetical protein